MKGSLNTTGSHLLFCVGFMLLGALVMFMARGDMLIQGAGLTVFTGAFNVAARSMGSTDPEPQPTGPTKVTVAATETKTTTTEPTEPK